MPKLSIHAGDLVVVSDGRKALLLENAGDGAFPNLAAREVHERADAPSRELGSDKPGRAFQAAASTIRSAMDQTDPHEEAEHRFVEQVMDRVHELVRDKVTNGVVIVAPPRVLGLVRKIAKPTVKSAIRAEIGHDYTHLPVYEIEKRLVEAEASAGNRNE
jgi:protein required for attachment to host cells